MSPVSSHVSAADIDGAVSTIYELAEISAHVDGEKVITSQPLSVDHDISVSVPQVPDDNVNESGARVRDVHGAGRDVDDSPRRHRDSLQGGDEPPLLNRAA